MDCHTLFLALYIITVRATMDCHTLFLAEVTTLLLNFISSLSTPTLPLAAAMWAIVIPFYTPGETNQCILSVLNATHVSF